MKKIFLPLFLAAIVIISSPAVLAACPDICDYTLHTSVTVVNSLSITEDEPLKFGNFSVTSAGVGDATIVMDIYGSRTKIDGGSDKITLLRGVNNGAVAADDAGSQSPATYALDNGMGASSIVFISFADSNGGAMGTCPSGNHVDLGTPPNTFCVDNFVFNSDSPGGDSITTDNTGKALIHVGATLHTVAGATYAPGTYRGTFNIMASH